jgi:hypothetical protein
VSSLSTFIQHSFGIPSQSNKIGKRNKRNSNRKGRNQTIPICRWHGYIAKNYQNAPGHHKCLQQSSSVQNQYTKNQKLLYIPIISRLRKNLGKQFHLQ